MMLLSLLLLLGGYFLVQHFTQRTDAGVEKGSFPLTEKAAEDVQAFQWVKEENAFDFTCTDGVWQKTDDPAFPCNQRVLSAMATNLTGLNARQKLENVKELADYGLTNPQFTVHVTWQDGSETAYHMGNATPFDDGYYMLLSSDENTVYVVEKSLSSLFYKDQVDMADLKDIPSVHGADRLVVEGKLDVTKKDASSTLSSTDLWYDTQSGEALDSAAVDALLTKLSSLRWADLYAPAPTQEELAALKLNGKGTDITVYAGEEVLLTLHVGLANPADKVHHVCLGDDLTIYTVNTSSISAILAADAKAMPRTQMTDTLFTDLEQMIFAIGDQTWQFDVTHTPATEDDAATEDDESADAVTNVTLNGESTDAASAQNVWNLVSALLPQGRAENCSADETLLTISARDHQGRVLSIQLHPMDATHYWADVSDGTPLLFPAADADTLIRTLKSYQ